MFNIFNSNVFVEIGEAIGNVGRKAFRRRTSNPELVDEAFRRRLRRATPVEVPLAPDPMAEPDDEVIDVEYRVLDDEEVLV